MRIPRIPTVWRYAALDVAVVVAAVLALNWRLPFTALLSAPGGLADPLLTSTRMFKFTAAHVANNELPLWNPYVLTGYPFLALGLGGVFYPPTWAYSRDAVNDILRYDLLGHAVLAAVFCYLLARDVLKHRVSAIVVAIASVYLPAAANLYGGQHVSVVHAAAYFPLVLLFCRRVLVTNHPVWALFLALVLAVQVLTGAFQYLFFEFAALAIFIVADLARRYLAEWEPALPVACKGIFALTGIALALALAGVQFTPSLEWLGGDLVSHSRIAKIGATSADFSVFPFALWPGPGTVLPAGALYFGGPFLLALATFGFVRAVSREKWVFLIAVLQGVVYIHGDYKWLSQSLFPLVFFNASHSTGQIASLAAVFLLLLSGLGMDAILDAPKGIVLRFRHFWPLHLALDAILAACTASLYPEFQAAMIATAVLAAAGVLAATVGRVPAPAIAIWLAGCLALDLFAAVPPARAEKPATGLYADGGQFAEIAKLHQGFDRVALVTELNDTQHLEAGTANNERTFSLFSGQGFRYAAQIRGAPLVAPVSAEELTFLQGFLRLLDALNVGYVMTPKEGSPFLDSVSGDNLFFQKQQLSDSVIYKSVNVLPMAYIVHHADLREANAAFIRTLTAGTIDVRKTVLLDRPLEDGQLRETSAPEGFRLERYTEREIELALSVAAPGILVLSDTYAPGWHATVNGSAPRPVLRANESLRGVPVVPGDNKILFRYDPPAIAQGLMISEIAGVVWLGLAGALGIAWLISRRSRRTALA